MSDQYTLSTKKYEEGAYIHFHNHTNSFVEVVFVINGREMRENTIPSKKTRGYGFAPKLDKFVRKRKDGSLVPLRNGDVVQAFVYAGTGSYKESDIDKPAFLRHRLIDKFSFSRLSDEPVEVLEIKY